MKRFKELLFGPVFLFWFSSWLLADANVLTNPGFESGTTGWAARSCTISAVTSPVRSGSYSARATGRTATWQGIQQTLMDKVVVGQTYQISGYVRVSTASSTVKVSVQKTDGNGTTYTNVASGTANDTGWVYLSGNYTVTVTGTLTELWVYFEGPASGVDLYVDDAAVYGPTVSNEASLQISAAARYQTIEGFGAAGAWYESMLTGHTQKATLYNLLFRDLGLDIYRVRNTYDQSGGADYMSRSAQIIAAGQAALGRPLKVLLSCWSPPAYLKSNGDTANGGTLIGGPSNYAYDQLADWFADSITAWNNLGVTIDYLSIQNEPDWTASWDTCRYEPSETSTYAGYNKAFQAVYNELYARFGTAMPKMLAPETTGLYGAAGSSPSAYISALLDPAQAYGYAHHLYNINAGDNPDAYLTAMQSFRAQWGTKPLFQTEYEKATGSWPDAYNLALLLHNALTVEQVSAYLYWDLFWGSEGGLITLNSTSTYTINSDYWGFKQFSGFIHSGWQRIGASSNSPLLRVSAYISPNNQNLTAVLINTSDSITVNASLAFSDFTVTGGTIYRTSQTENCVNLGTYTGGPLSVPPKSVTTLALTGYTGPLRTLTVSSSDGGAVSAPGEGTFTYYNGTVLSIAASADASWRFVQWTGTAVDAGKVANPSAASTTVTVDGDYTLYASFEYDLTPPSPQPAWQLLPTAEGPTRLTMAAVSCTDDNPPVEYYFECLTEPSLSSGWQTSPAYSIRWLSPASEYVFRFKARDSAAAQNETEWSSQISVITENPRLPVQILSNWQSGLSHTALAGSNRLLVFTAHAEASASLSLSSVTYGGVPMLKIAEREHGTTTRIYTAAFILNEAGIAAASSGTFVPTWNVTPSSVGYASAFLFNVHPTSPVSFKAVNSGTTATVSTAPLYAEAGDLVVAVGACGNTGTYTPENGFLKAVELTISSADGVVAYKTAGQAADETPALTHSSVNRQAVLGFVVQGIPRDWLYGDFNWDLTVNLDDLPIFIESWLAEDCGRLDLNSDCRIDLTELAGFAAGWLRLTY
ncbi:MAG TPA: carbohydrate binding domain-containing protein [Anaerohalosphaeraceae bacterium]|nr:carbohydrate binding domain-containing protein [Anaerohalosphaeraceae bacterium]